MMARHQPFRDLHQQGGFVIPKPWDMESTRMMAALAMSSAAYAFTMGRPDSGGVSRDEALVQAQMMLAATVLPLSGDFENGLADDPGGVADSIRLAAGPLKAMSVAELAAMGARRVLTGSQIARLTHAAMSGDAMLEAGRG